MTAGFEFYIDIEDAAGRVGSGPIVSASKWTYTARMDRAGSFAFEMPAADPKAAAVLRKRKARAWARIGGQWTEVGAGIIDSIQRQAKPDGAVVLIVSGDDELRELAGRSVGWLNLSGSGAGLTHAAALSAVGAAAATGWTFTPAAAPPNNYIYGRFAGESVLAALVGVAQKTQTHFYRSGPRALTFASGFSASGLRAVRADGGDLAAETCAVMELVEAVETFDLLTRIVPLGAGNGETRLTLAASTRSAPSGYTVNKTANWLQHDGAVAEFGVIDAPWIEFKDVRPISNTDADLQAAANMLFDQALKELTRRALDMQVATYQAALAGCSQLLRPLQSLRLTYRDLDAGIDVDREVNILAATWEIGPDGVQTTALELSTSDLWPQDDVGTVVERIMEGTVYQAHPQLNANAYVIAYTKHLDDAQLNPAQFRFRFDQEVTQLTRVVFDFQLLSLESTVKSVASSSATSAASGDHTHGVTLAGHTHTVSILDHSHSVSVSDHSHAFYVPDHVHGVTVPSHQHDVTLSNHTHTTPNHTHRIRIGGGSSPTYPVGFSAAGTSGGLVSNASGSDFNLPTNSGEGGSTSGSGGGTTATSASGGGASLTASAGGATSTTTGAGGGTTVTSSSGGGSTPTTSSGGGTTATSASGGSHTHTVTPSISMEYGVFRDSTGNVFALGDLEYSLDGASWFFFIPGVNGYASLGGGWHRVDLTALLQNSTTLRPQSSNNTLQIRRKLTGTAGKKCTIDAQLSVRTIIQAIAFT